MYIAKQAGITRARRNPGAHRRTCGRRTGLPLSIEKFCPVLSFYVVKDWRDGCERCKEILRYGGMGHTMSIHSRNDDIILQFGLKKPAYRIVVNTPTTHGSIGLTTGLDPAMTLGCGGYGGNITSDNISPRHLLNIKRLSYEITPAIVRREPGTTPALTAQGPRKSRSFRGTRSGATCPTNRSVSGVAGLWPRPHGRAPHLPCVRLPGTVTQSVDRSSAKPAQAAATEKPAEFVCEDDVRQALRQGRKILHWRPVHCDAGGPGPGGAAPPLCSGGMAALTAFLQ